MKKQILIVAAVTAVFLAVGIDVSFAAGAKGGGTLAYATGTDATTLDPQFVTDVPTSRMVMHIHETLVYPDVEGNMQPILAESWSISDDKLTWTFKLRKGVQFHDGTPFNAEAVKYTFDRIQDPEIGSPRKSAAKAVKEVKVIDEHTVAFVTEKPFAPFLAQLSAYNLAIISPAEGKKQGKKYGQNPCGTGPFKLESWSPGEKMVLSRNESYWGEKPAIDKLEVRIVPEDSSRVMMLLGGEVDVISSVPPVMISRLEKSKDVRIIKKTGFRTVYIGLNNTMKPFDDLRVRRAVAHAIDSEAIVKGVLGGVGTVGGGFESPVIPGAHKDLKPYAYNPAESKKLLAEAGYPNGFTVQFYTPTGRYLMDRQVAEAVQAQLKEVGIDARLQVPDWGAYQALLDKGTEAPIFLLGKGSPTGDLDLTATLCAACKGKMNHFNYCNPEVDKLIEQQRGTVDVKERNEILAKLQEIFYREVPAVVLFYEDQIYGTRANVKGVEVNPNEFVGFFKAVKE
jgi:peptide/nickel transport system substrate-binding protein